MKRRESATREADSPATKSIARQSRRCARRAPLGTLAPRARVEATKTVGTLSTQLWSCARPGSGFARCGRLSFAFLTLTFRVRNHGPKCESDLCVLRGPTQACEPCGDGVGFTTRTTGCDLRRGSEGYRVRIAARRAEIADRPERREPAGSRYRTVAANFPFIPQSTSDTIRERPPGRARKAMMCTVTARRQPVRPLSILFV